MHEHFSAGALQRAGHAHVIGMKVRDEHALYVFETDSRIRESTAERLFGLCGVKTRVDEAPTVIPFNEIGVHDRQTAYGEGDRDAPDARRDEIAQRAVGPREVTLGTMEVSGPFV